MSVIRADDYDEVLIHNMDNERTRQTLKAYDFVWINDTNSGTYQSGQIQFDGMSLANSKAKYIWSEGYVTIPFTTLLSGPTTSLTNLPGSVTMKAGGALGVVDQVNVYINGTSVSNNSKFAGVLQHYRNMLAFSGDKLKEFGPSLLFAPDSSTSYATAGNTDPTKQILNNVNEQSLLDPSAGVGYIYLADAYNAGALMRSQYTGQEPALSTTEQNMSDSLRNYAKVITGTVNSMGNRMLLTIPLKYLHNIFEKLDYPISNLHVQLYVNVNQGSITYSGAGGATSNIDSVPVSASINGSCCPIMLTSVGNGNVQATPQVATLQFAVGTDLTANGGTVSALQKSCRLYVPKVAVSAEIELRALANPVPRIVKYLDYQLFQFPNAGPTISWNVSQGVNSLRRIWIMGFNAGINFTAGNNVSSVLNAKSSEPFGGSSFGFGLKNIQLMLNGANYYSNNIQYSYEEFLHNVHSGTYAAGQDDMVASGLIDFHTWENCPVYVFDVSRNDRLSDPSIPVSIQLIATGSGLVQDLYAFCEYERTVTIMSTDRISVNI